MGGWWVGSGWSWWPRALVSPGPRLFGSVRDGWSVGQVVRWSVVDVPSWLMSRLSSRIFVNFRFDLGPNVVEM